ncbi:MAG: YggT family protein [Actinobacteria bacterium]|nr:MAG: YggT family protein [Actinomycetota bacterium]
MSISGLVRSLISFYGILVFAYVILSWFRPTGAIYDVYRVLAQVCEPYVGIFRRIVPPMGPVDFSPWVAVLVLQYLIGPVLVTLLRTAGL